jgi:hypothetical protein
MAGDNRYRSVLERAGRVTVSAIDDSLPLHAVNQRRLRHAPDDQPVESAHRRLEKPSELFPVSLVHLKNTVHVNTEQARTVLDGPTRLNPTANQSTPLKQTGMPGDLRRDEVGLPALRMKTPARIRLNESEIGTPREDISGKRPMTGKPFEHGWSVEPILPIYLRLRLKDPIRGSQFVSPFACRRFGDLMGLEKRREVSKCFILYNREVMMPINRHESSRQ